MNNLPTASLSRMRENAKRRLATPSVLARVISGSATRRSSLALGKVVRISSCLNSEDAMLRNMACRWALVRLSLRPDFWWRMVLIPIDSVAYSAQLHAVGNARRRPVLELHAEGKPAATEDVLDFRQRLLAEVWGLEQLHLGLLHQVADVIDALRLQAVCRAHGELQVVDRAQQQRIESALLGLGGIRLAPGEVTKHGQLVVDDLGRLAHGIFS